MSSNQPIPDPSQSNIFAPLERTQEIPPTSVPPDHEHIELGQQGSNINVRKVVRPVHEQEKQNQTMPGGNTVPPRQAPTAPGGQEVAPPIRPAFPGHSPATPPTPTHTQDNGLRLRSFASSGIDFLPTTNLPIIEKPPQNVLPVTPPEGVRIPAVGGTFGNRYAVTPRTTCE